MNQKLLKTSDYGAGFTFEGRFMPTLAAIGLGCITWEELLAVVSEHNELDGRGLGNFYAKCLEFNKFVAKRYAV